MTVKGMAESIREQLKEAGIECSAIEARFMVKSLAGLSAGSSVIFGDSVLDDQAVTRLEQAVEKRKSGYPLQYILGNWEFYGYTFYVGEGVLIPRQDTETLVEQALKRIANIKNPKVADLCSGTGCVAIAIGKKRKDAKVLALELYDEAYSYLEKNIESNDAHNVMPLKADVLGGVAAKFKDSFDLIVSNPPYIRTGDLATLQKEVQYEPTTALDGSEDGLKFYREITDRWKDCLKPDGTLMFEVGYDEGDAVYHILRSGGFEDVVAEKDLSGIKRVVAGSAYCPENGTSDSVELL